MQKTYKHKLDLKCIDVHLLDKQALDSEYEYKVDELKEMYRTMLSIRRLEECSQQLFDRKMIRGFCHLASGQESIYAAFKHAISGEDTATSSYRCHGLSYVTGDSARVILAEMLGRDEGMCGGKGGSMHLYNKAFYGGHGIVGAQVPISLGLAFRHKYVNLAKGDKLDKMVAKNVSFAFYGDGAANQGQIFESYNMAMLWKLPIIFVCENNDYGMWTRVETASSNTNFYKRGDNIPGIRVSHENVLDLIAVFKFCREYALKTCPLVLEIATYRLCTHSARDQTDFRSKQELTNRAKIDPINHFKSFLAQFVPENEIRDIEKSVHDTIDRESNLAQSAKEPQSTELFTNVLIQ